MAKRSKQYPMTPGTHWVAGGEGWVPFFVWKKMTVEGPPRPAKMLLPQEAFQVVMEFANAAGTAVFGVAPYHTKEVDGRATFEPNIKFDEIPTIKDLLGGLKDPNNIEIKKSEVPVEKEVDGIPMDQIDPATLPE